MPGLVHRCAGFVLLAIFALGSPAPGAAAAEQRYKIELTSLISEKPFKFFVVTKPTKASCSMEYAIKPGTENHEIDLRSLDYTWQTTGLDLWKKITPEQVEYSENKRQLVQWTPGMTKKGEVNPLEVFAHPIGFLTAGGRDVGVITNNPGKFVKFIDNFGFGKAPLLHRPPLPKGELKQGQTFTTEAEIPDPTYAAVPWTANVQWTIDSVTGTGDEAVLMLSGVCAATQEKTASRHGPLTDGVMSYTGSVKIKANGELVSGDSRVEIRWKQDPSGPPTGVMDSVGDCKIHEVPVERK